MQVSSLALSRSTKTTRVLSQDTWHARQFPPCFLFTLSPASRLIFYSLPKQTEKSFLTFLSYFIFFPNMPEPGLEVSGHQSHSDCEYLETEATCDS